MRFDVLTLFPELIQSYCNTSILANAQKSRVCEVLVHNPRDFSLNKHKKVDDTPYGGGAGMLLSPQPFYDCLESVISSEDHEDDENAEIGVQLHALEVVIFSPRGEVLNQQLVSELAQKKQIIMLCGHYEGFDERIYSLATKVISLGDFILTGGELAAMAVIDSVSRLVPNVLGSAESHAADSFSTAQELFHLNDYDLTKAELKRLQDLLLDYDIKSLESFRALRLLEYPHYTRPKDFGGSTVPEILQSGDHKKILFWRIEEALKMTKKYRPDLFIA
ncbi:MAG: tRNA (guanosine(37)-N1)-methyltransferase TrmD [Candidatus Melainabacteria bacterium]|nr:tRNA (guanosine(37)-N1)-methyltransferase TrmD [Candidatus Melainabacteria bacterium]